MTDEPAPRKGILDHLEGGLRIWEIGTGLIAVVAAIVGFVNSNGGPVYILVQIGIFGFACYVAYIPAAIILLGFIGAFEKATNRDTTDTAQITLAAIIAIVIALFVRFGLFYEGIGEPGDLDAFGTVFTACVGALILLLPLVGLLWFKGSTPRSSNR